MPDPTREEVLDGLDGSAFDVVIVGGGINGAGVARDAALRGLRLCLFEQGDFAGGMLSKSTKIAHGGLRYLRNFEFGLVRESQVERLRLRRLSTALNAAELLLPGLPRRPRLAAQGAPGRRRVYAARRLQRAQSSPHGERRRWMRTLVCGVEGLAGAVRYWDDRMDDARIVLETVLSAEEAGATCLNCTKVTSLE